MVQIGAVLMNAPVEAGLPESRQVEPATEVGESGGSPASPTPFSYVTTPSGIEIAYYVKPRRKYEIRRAIRAGAVGPEEGVDWREVPSVTTVLDVLEKGGLSWWGMKIGVEGTIALAEKGVVLNLPKLAEIADRPLVVEEIVGHLKAHNLTVNDTLGRASTRGQNVHDAWEKWQVTGELPDPLEYPLSEHGYVTGLRRFLEAAQGKLRSIEQEIMVASYVHGYAGRFDTYAQVTEPIDVVTKLYPKWPPKWTQIPVGFGILDLKTSKGIYAEHGIQLEAYEAGRVECGYEPSDWRAVLHVTQDGLYEVRRSRAKPEHFVAVLGAYHALKEAEEAMKV